MAKDALIVWLENEITACNDRIRSIEVEGWRWLNGAGNEPMHDVTAAVLAEAKERLVRSEEQLARMRGGL